MKLKTICQTLLFALVLSNIFSLKYERKKKNPTKVTTLTHTEEEKKSVPGSTVVINNANLSTVNIGSKKAILFLHAFGQNAETFKTKLQPTPKTIIKNIKDVDLLFAEAPLDIDDYHRKLYGKELSDEKMKGWFNIEPHFDNKKNLEPRKYENIEKSLELLRSTLKDHNNIQAIVGFSQGGMMAILLTVLRQEKQIDWLPNLKCVIIAGSAIFGIPTPNKNLDPVNKFVEGKKKVELPSLHIMGKDDNLLPWEDSLETALTFFKDPEIYQHEGKHYIPSKKKDLDTYVEFLKKHLSP